jgi:hypothetical protein
MPSAAHAERAQQLIGQLTAWLIRPRVRLVVTGVVLLLLGALVVTSSMWTLPLLICGATMVGVAWIGSRLEGHFTVEWGAEGTQLHFGARIKPAAQGTAGTASRAIGEDAISTIVPPDAEVVEGDAHTVEIEVAELEALIAAAATVTKSQI